MEPDPKLLHSSPDTLQLSFAVVSIVLLSSSVMLYYSGARNTTKADNRAAPLFTTSQWRRVHILSQFVFQGVVYGGTTSEIIAYTLGRYDVMLRNVVPYLDHMIALPSLALCGLSGTALTHNLYVRNAQRKRPPQIEQTVRLLNLFGVYWVVADKVTQYAPVSSSSSYNMLFALRLGINMGSCAISFRLWWLMSSIRKRK